MRRDQNLKKVVQATINGDKEAVKSAISDALSAGVDPEKVIDEGLSKGISVVGEKFANGEMFLSQMIFAAEAVKAGISILLPHISKEKAEQIRLGTVVIGTVKGDIHDIGKNLVAIYLSTAGFDVHDLGVDVDPIDFILKAEEVNADIIAMSSLLSATRVYQRDTVKYLEDTGKRNKFLLIVGGRAATPEWAEQIKADGYASLAPDAVDLCKKLVLKRSKPT